MQQQQQPPQGSGGYAGVSPENMVSFGGSSSTPRAQMLAGGGGGGGSEQVEAASPISSRPPASSINFDELGDDPDRAGGGGGGVSSGNRWPRQETHALLKIRSEMDVAFRDATLKGPLWDEVSRKLGELGYVRSAKKCKEKFENVHKYYKRTKEGRAGRQDGKSYRFFTQLEALQGAPTASGSGGVGGNLIPSAASPVMTSGPPNPATSTAAAASVGNIQFATPVSVGTVGGGGDVMQIRGLAQPFTMYSSMGQQAMLASRAPPGPAATVAPPGGIGISFSSDSGSSESFDSEEDEDEEVEDMSEEELDRPLANPVGSGQKRKRGYSKGGNKRRMMDFFEGLMKQVMQKQEAMQQRFLEIIEKREQDRLMREEAWKRQEAARLNREQELGAQERVMAASRDAAIVSFLQKITGQTIQLPQPVYTTTVHHPPPPAPTIPPSSAPLPTSTPPHSRQQFIQKPQQQIQLQQHHMPPPQPTEAIMAVPERQIPPQDPDPTTGGSISLEPASSRWPKAEVLALIKLRSNLENRYQESGPKGPLWEEISAGMQRMGYNRSSKRCKEKWENINKYFKKVKESNKKRPEDAKTCPYFNELDALYQRKKLGSSSSSSMALFQQQQIQPQQAAAAAAGLALDQSAAATNLQELASATVQASSAHVEPMTIGAAVPDPVQPNKGGLPDSIFCDQGSTDAGGSRKPEDIMMEQQAAHNQLNLDDYDQKMDELGDSTDNNLEDDQGDNDEDESESDRKMGYKIEFQAGAQSNNKNGGSNNNEAPSFITMVQ